MRGLDAAATDALDRRLTRVSKQPLAVALSGGGDSVALTLMADSWAREAARELLILHVDHRLQTASRAWATACADLARRLGRPFRRLEWRGDKPAAGLPAAARAARHRLLADAARDAGAGVILMGHTADDVAEAAAMRAAGATTPSPREWAPSPAWPEGRGVFLLRPLIGVRRGSLRDWLRARGEGWIDDPANEDPRYARSRARAAGPPGCTPAPEPAASDLSAQATEAAGAITLPREAIRAAQPDDLRRLLALACVCAGGGDRRPATAGLVRLAEAVRGGGAFTATLAGARVTAEGDVRIAREPGEAARGGLAALTLAPGVPAVWDGRFEITAAEGARVERLAGRRRRLSAEARRRLAALPADVRGGLPVLLDAAGEVHCPLLEDIPGVRVRSLVGERLRAASGLVSREGA